MRNNRVVARLLQEIRGAVLVRNVPVPALAETALEPDGALFQLLAQRILAVTDAGIGGAEAKAGDAGALHARQRVGIEIGILRRNRQRAEIEIGHRHRMRGRSAIEEFGISGDIAGKVERRAGIGVDVHHRLLQRRNRAEIVAADRQRSRSIALVRRDGRAVGADKRGAFQRAAGDQPAGHRRRSADARHHDRLRLAIGGGIGRIVDDLVAFEPLARLRLVAGAIIVVFGVDFEMAAPVGETGAICQRSETVGAIAVLRNTALDFQFQPGELAIEHEVDHAGDRVGTPTGGCAAGNDVDAADQPLGHQIGIDAAGDHARRHAVPIEQHERAQRPEAAQVQDIGAGGVGRSDALRMVRAGAEQLRQLVEVIGNVRWRKGLDLRRADHRGGRRRIVSGALDARAGDNDTVGRFGVGCGRIRRGLGPDRRCGGNGGEKQGAFELREFRTTVHYRPPCIMGSGYGLFGRSLMPVGY